ncbi:CoA-transferase family III domain-containing protein [Lobosporangium transversale]|uniref:CoA-transferase family III domain-containing protein n=1 Tax=Lobosporangium transversale TaxID=64571 RepID=A0A1Y2GR38_9FUNG|nr:CoA-transferase family III domain-containing protein [Lobosporangium transversale]ORZ19986.1 CoA-transferase family III domain-containing protein [Lobosporangium transversale]|eukprot:XP_021882526.1 CoA-transferase family III domain-containing protein [Lobosporangium transversale]
MNQSRRFLILTQSLSSRHGCRPVVFFTSSIRLITNHQWVFASTASIPVASATTASTSRGFSVYSQTSNSKQSSSNNCNHNNNMIESLLSQNLYDTDSRGKRPYESGQEPGPLHGIRVLDLTRVLAGPYCTQLLGDLGAEVIKVENPNGGDDTRAWGPPFAKNFDGTETESAYFLSVNRNKKSITVNIRSGAGRQLIYDLVKKADVFIENYIPGKLADMGLGYSDLSALNPRLVYASITGYGQTGPYSSRPGYDVMIEAEAGLMFITGEEHGPPVKVGVAVTDLTTGLYAHASILAALFARNRTGRGQHVDCSLLESQVATLANIGSSYLIAGKEAKRMGTAHPSIVPYQVLQTRDSHIMIGAGNDGQFRTLCKVLQLDTLADNPRYKTNRDRVSNRDELIQILTNRLKSENKSFWMKALEGRGVPFAPINNIADTFAHPQVLARGMVQEVEHPKAGKIKLCGPPVKYSDTKPTIRTPAPLLGEHTDEVLADILGYDESTILDLKQKNAV